MPRLQQNHANQIGQGAAHASGAWGEVMPIGDRDNVISVDAALALLKKGETVHAFTGGGNILIGADWDRADVEKAIRDFGGAWVAGEQAQAMKHGIAVEQDSWIYFFETEPARSEGGEA